MPVFSHRRLRRRSFARIHFEYLTFLAEREVAVLGPSVDDQITSLGQHPGHFLQSGDWFDDEQCFSCACFRDPSLFQRRGLMDSAKHWCKS